MTIEELDNLPMFFIVGAGRSGTTLTRTILDAHPNVAVPMEGKIILHLKLKYNSVRNWNQKLIVELVDDLFEDRLFASLWNIDRQLLINNLSNLPMHKLNFGLICKFIYLQSPSIFKKENIVVIGDKNPIYSMCIPEIQEVFPKAKFIHLVRDYRDVIASNLKHFKRKNVAVLSQFWKQYNSWIEKEKKKNPDFFITIRYEDMVAEPKKTCQKISAFLHIPFREEMLNYHQQVSQLFIPQENKVFKEMFSDLARPITSENSNKWMGKFSDEELKIIYSILYQDGLKYGYEANKVASEKGESFASQWGFLINVTDVIIVKTYYLIPIFIRKFVRKVSDFIFQKTGYTTVYNEELNQLGMKPNKNDN